MVLACDLVVASRHTRFALPEVKRGLLALYGGVFRGARALPLNLAREMALTGEPIDAERAHALGLVNRLCDDGAALDTALALAETICANSPVAVRESLRVIDQSIDAGDALAWQLSAEAAATVRASRGQPRRHHRLPGKTHPAARPLNRRPGLERGCGAAQGYIRCCRFQAAPMIPRCSGPKRRAPFSNVPINAMETQR